MRAIPAAAGYLRASGAPGDYRRAIFAYNHADWYVAGVLDRAARYRGALADPPATGPARRVPLDGTWLAPVPGTGARCDERIVPDVRFLVEHFGLRITACFAATGHAPGGEHPLGLAIDAVPADGDWDRTMAAARFFAWTPRCGETAAPDACVRRCGWFSTTARPDTVIRRTARRPRVRRICTCHGCTPPRRR